MIEIENIRIGPEEITESFVRCSGPGGQNVNKVNSGVQLRFNAAESPSLPEGVRRRLMVAAGNRLTRGGEIVITVQTHRSQADNRQEALGRLGALIMSSLKPPKRRRPTGIPRASRRRRLEDKRYRSRVKTLRRNVRDGSRAGGAVPSA